LPPGALTSKASLPRRRHDVGFPALSGGRLACGRHDVSHARFAGQRLFYPEGNRSLGVTGKTEMIFSFLRPRRNMPARK
jgi:hypothetical protein